MTKIHYVDAIELLSRFFDAKAVCIVTKESGLIDAQLVVGPGMSIAINDSMVDEDELYNILIDYECSMHTSTTFMYLGEVSAYCGTGLSYFAA